MFDVRWCILVLLTNRASPRYCASWSHRFGPLCWGEHLSLGLQAGLDVLLMHIQACASFVEYLHLFSPFETFPSRTLSGGYSNVGVDEQRFSSACCCLERTSEQRNNGWFLRTLGSVSWTGSCAQ